MNINDRFDQKLIGFLEKNGIYLIFLIAAYRFVGLGFGEMQQWDESLYALRILCLWHFGDIWDQTPHMLGGVYYSAHPPLYVWLSTFFTVLFGKGLWVFRLASALSVAFSVFLLFRMAIPNKMRIAGLIAAAFLGFMPLVTFYSRQGQLDTFLMTLMLATLYFMLKYLNKPSSQSLVFSGISLGMALMTKFLFALSIPVAALIAGFLVEKEMRSRMLKLTFIPLLVSIPLWFPWVLAFTYKYGDSDPFFLFASGMPFGKTLSGIEGTTKDTGSFYYLNQLTIHLSIFFPLFFIGVVRAFFRRENTRSVFLAVFVLFYLTSVWLMKSSFAVYLIPIFPAAILLAMDIFQRVRDWYPFEQSALVFFMGLCGFWSISFHIREGVKNVVHSMAELSLPLTGSLLLFLLFFVSVLILSISVWILYRKDKINMILNPFSIAIVIAIFGITTMYRIWMIDPLEYTDGASEVTIQLMKLHVHSVVMIGNGENPQLTYYLDGADINWPDGSRKVYQRMEPRVIGAQTIKMRLSELMKQAEIAVIIEKDEISQGVYRSPSDVLPKGYKLLLEEKRYALVLLSPSS